MCADNDLWSTSNCKSAFGYIHGSKAYPLDTIKKSYFFLFLFDFS